MLHEYCQKWKLTVYTMKVMFLEKEVQCRLRNNISFTYASESLDSVSKFVYLGIVLTTGVFF